MNTAKNKYQKLNISLIIPYLVNWPNIPDTELIRINIDAEVIMILGLSALSRNKIGLKNIPPPIPTIPDINPKIDPMIKQINLGNDL